MIHLIHDLFNFFITLLAVKLNNYVTSRSSTQSLKSSCFSIFKNFRSLNENQECITRNRYVGDEIAIFNLVSSPETPITWGEYHLREMTTFVFITYKNFLTEKLANGDFDLKSI